MEWRWLIAGFPRCDFCPVAQFHEARWQHHLQSRRHCRSLEQLLEMQKRVRLTELWSRQREEYTALRKTLLATTKDLSPEQKDQIVDMQEKHGKEEFDLMAKRLKLQVEMLD